jgi:DNA-binding NarL/FixJ family response regulator
MATVFAIDDDLDDLAILDEVIREIDRTVLFAGFTSSENAFEWLKNPNHPAPAIVLIDLNMPKMNGIECLEKLTKLECVSNSTIAILSTTVTNDARNQAKNRGAHFAFRKPNNFKEYAELIKKLIAHSKFILPRFR